MAERTGFLKLVRTYTGLASALAFNLGTFGVTVSKSVCSPGFNCHGCPWSSMACPVGVMAYGAAVRTFPALAVGTVLAVGAVLGRLVCGFACPFGWLQDLLHRIPTRKFGLPRWTRWTKYAALALLVVILPLALGFRYSGMLKVNKPQPEKNASGGLDVTVKVTNYSTEPLAGPALDVVFRDNATKQEVFRERREFPAIAVAPGESVALPGFTVPNMLNSADLVVTSPQSETKLGYHYELYYCRLCPNGTLSAALPAALGASDRTLLASYWGSPLRYSILAFFLIFMVLVSRAFCRTFCPLGAIYGLCSRLALVRIKTDLRECVECRLCDKACPVDLDVRKEAGGPECIACGDCIRACPKGGIRRQVGL
ncbi:MAG TPA: 4Fe-4S binding protein [Planctomycetota bacterium]|nr:4Fe-4S binding protein [Planctomycetota bacterium]